MVDDETTIFIKIVSKTNQVFEDPLTVHSSTPHQALKLERVSVEVPAAYDAAPYGQMKA